MMNRSSRFISLSGMAGISAGIIAMLAAYIAHHYVFIDTNLLSFEKNAVSGEQLNRILSITIGTLVLSIGATIFFTTKETRKRKEKVWDQQAKQLVIALAIPLVSGGLLCCILLVNGLIGLTIPMMLIFYGLALVNASKYTLREVRILGIIEIFLGLVGFIAIDYSLAFWATGFGILHIIYGLIIQRKSKA